MPFFITKVWTKSVIFTAVDNMDANHIATVAIPGWTGHPVKQITNHEGVVFKNISVVENL